MRFLLHKRFKKELQKLSVKDQTRVKERLKFFVVNPHQPQLRNHALKGKFLGYRSIDIKPNLRAVYLELSKEEVRFIALGSHNQLYR